MSQRLFATMKLLLLRLLAMLGRLLVARPAHGPLRRVLVIKPDHLGDLLLATPALHALRQALPNAKIVGLVGPWARLIWADTGDLDALAELPFPGFAREPAVPAYRPYLLLFKYALLLRLGRYDAALLLRDDHWWGAALALLAGVPRRVGHAHPLCAPFLSEALPYDPNEHVTRQSLAVVARLISGSQMLFDTKLHFDPPPADEAWAAAWQAENLLTTEELLIIHPGTGGPTKHWLPASWASVADELAARPGVRVLLTGGQGERELVCEIAAQMACAPLVLAGRTSVGQLTALLGRAALVLGVDSGPLHLAASQGTPTVHLYGPSDVGRFGPWGDPLRQRVVRSGIACSPCGVFGACPRGTDPPECMALITVQQVLRAAERA